MGTEEIEIVGIGMGLGRRERPGRDPAPIELQAREMGLFQLLPEAQAVQPSFEPVMMPRHYSETAKEEQQRGIAGLVPPEFIRRNGPHGADEKDHESPAGEPSARLHGPVDPVCETAQRPTECHFSKAWIFDWWHIRHSERDDTG